MKITSRLSAVVGSGLLGALLVASPALAAEGPFQGGQRGGPAPHGNPGVNKYIGGGGHRGPAPNVRPGPRPGPNPGIGRPGPRPGHGPGPGIGHGPRPGWGPGPGRPWRPYYGGTRYLWGGLPFYFYDGYYYGDCRWLRRRAEATGSSYWWTRYRQCRDFD